MRIAIVKNGIVDNVVEGTQEYADSVGGIVTELAHIGGTYDGTNFTAPASNEPPNSVIDSQIANLEGKAERGIRESILFLTVAEAARLGLTEPQLYASNYGYRKARDLDNAIAALRAQRV